MRVISSLVGLLIAPLPVALSIFIMASGISEAAALRVEFSAMVGAVYFVIPFLLTKGITSLLSWRSLRSHLGTMLTLSFLPMLSIYALVDFEPDAAIGFQLNESGPLEANFAFTGVLIAIVAAFLNTVGFALYWIVSRRLRPKEVET